MGIEAAVIGGSALLGGLATSQGKKSTSSSVQEPWSVQAPYLKTGFEEAQSIYDAQKGTPWYTGNLYTGLNDTQKAGIDGTVNWANTNGGLLARNTTNASTDALTRGNFFGDNATKGAAGQWGVGVPQDQSGLMATYGAQALGGTGFLTDNIWSTVAHAQDDPTQANIRAASSYADNPYLQSQIDAASADVTHQLGTDLVGLNNQASAGGNLNSSRAGAAEAGMREGAARTIGNISSTMRSNAYTQGLSLAEQARQANSQTNLGALSTGLQFTGQGLGALGAAQDARNAEIGNRITSNGQLAGQTGLGLQAADLSNSLGLGNSSAVLGAGSVMQDDANNKNSADYQKWLGGDTRKSDLLSRYWNINASNNWGGGTTSTSKTPGNFFQGALGGAALGAGMYKDFFNDRDTQGYGGTGAGRIIRGSTGLLGGGV